MKFAVIARVGDVTTLRCYDGGELVFSLDLTPQAALCLLKDLVSGLKA